MRTSFRVALAVSLAIFALAVAALPSLPDLFERKDVLLSTESRYQNIYVTQQGNVLMLRAGSLKSRSSAIDLESPFRHVMEYTGLMMVGLGYVEEPKSFLVLGLGGGTVTRHLRRYYPEARITSVELDPAVVEIAQSHFGFQADDQSQVVVEDARRFLTRTSETYDVIFLDAYHGDYIPFHLLTREFLELVRSHLRVGGAVVANTWSKQQLYERESATYAAVFEGFHSYLGRKTTNRIIVATRKPPAPYPTIERRFSRSQNRRSFDEVDLPSLLHRHFDRDLSWPADTPLLTDDYAPVNFLVQGENR